ncbi:MAG: DUF5009 domain-containing protein [Cyclobacteriaceae bacterium]|nr:DUF5009 domain-containing protein [Cyclobacteriaceae bacterium]
MKSHERLVSLDAFRGLTILLMIIVNTPGSWAHIYAPFRHSEWHGCTPTDLVFPFFLFIMGTAMWFSFKNYNHQFSTSALIKIVKRTLLIFLIGLFLNAFPKFNFDTLRIMGVLQRIALSYGLAGLLVLVLPKWGRYVVASVILLGYWFILSGYGTDPFSLEHNLAKNIDVVLFGVNHVYKGFGIPFDPEGLLSTLTASVNVLFGYFVGEQISISKNDKKLLTRLSIIGLSGIVLGLLWDLVFPINKPLWTSSYVLYSSGWAILLLSFFIWLIDLKGMKKWASPLVVFGMNPLVIFVLSIVWVKVLIYLVHFNLDGSRVNGYTWLYKVLFVPVAGNLNGSLAFALFHGILFWVVGYVLYRKRIVIKI